MLPDRVDGLAWQTADCLCSPLYGKGTGGSICTLGHVVQRAAVPALPHMLVAICLCHVVGPAGFAAGGLAYSVVSCRGGLIGP